MKAYLIAVGWVFLGLFIGGGLVGWLMWKLANKLPTSIWPG